MQTRNETNTITWWIINVVNCYLIVFYCVLLNTYLVGANKRFSVFFSVRLEWVIIIIIYCIYVVTLPKSSIWRQRRRRHQRPPHINCCLILISLPLPLLMTDTYVNGGRSCGRSFENLFYMWIKDRNHKTQCLIWSQKVWAKVLHWSAYILHAKCKKQKTKIAWTHTM